MASMQLKMKKSLQCVSIPNHADQVLKKHMQNWQKNKLCDVTLIAGVDGVKCVLLLIFTLYSIFVNPFFVCRVSAHRIILSSNSDYFSAMFCTPLKESQENEVELKNVQGNILKQLVAFCYSGFINLTESNVQALIEAANEFQLSDIVQVGSEFLIDQLDVENSVVFFLFSDRYELTELKTRAINFICKNFVKVAAGDEFKQILPPEKLASILSMDNLKIDSEEELFSAIAGWISVDEKRKAHLPEVIKHIRLTQLDQTVFSTLNGI